jgi:hypothetical protein
MAKWSDKEMAAGGITVDTWNTCPHCNCKEGELHNKFCPTQLSIDPNWPYKVSVKDEDTCPDCGDGSCECAAPNNSWLDETEEFRSVFVKPEYSDLFEVLRDALEEAQEGKGAVRHGNGLPFTEQPALTITRAVGRGFPLGQAMKKIQESQRMDDDAAKRELLGAINYLAAAILSFDE